MPRVRLKKHHIIIIGVLLLVGLGIFGIVRLFEYYYNPGGTIVVNPSEYQCWSLPDSHSLDIQRPRWKGVADQDTFSVYFGLGAAIDNLIANFTGGLSLDGFSEYLLAEETHYFYNYITIPSAGNWSILMINPHAYAISVENFLMSLVYPYNIQMILLIGFLVVAGMIAFFRNYITNLISSRRAKTQMMPSSRMDNTFEIESLRITRRQCTKH